MTRICLVGALTIVACGNKPDCEHYATHMAEVTTAGLHGDELESRRKTVEFGAREACTAGHVTTTEASCVIAASTADEIRHCAGLEDVPKAAAKPDVPKGVVVHRKGFAAQLPVGWREAPKAKDDEMLLRGDGVNGVMILRIDGSPLGLDSDAACRGVAERFASGNGTTLETSAVSSDHLGTSCHTIHHDDKMKIEGYAYAVGTHESLVINCFYPKAATASPAFCSDVIASVTVDRP
jgi:hypothetical protein